MYDIVIRIPENEPVTGQLGNGIYIVGSGADSHIQLDAGGISPRHCQLTVEDGGIKVMDLGSNTGTYLDGERLGVGAKEVLPGDEIRIGGIVIEFPMKDPEPIDARPLVNAEPEPPKGETPPPTVSAYIPSSSSDTVATMLPAVNVVKMCSSTKPAFFKVSIVLSLG